MSRLCAYVRQCVPTTTAEGSDTPGSKNIERPEYSPVLNLIENSWDALARHVSQRTHTRTEKHVQKGVRQYPPKTLR